MTDERVDPTITAEVKRLFGTYWAGGSIERREIERQNFLQRLRDAERQVEAQAYWRRVHEVERDLVQKRGHTEVSISAEAHHIVNREWGHNPLENLLAPDFRLQGGENA